MFAKFFVGYLIAGFLFHLTYAIYKSGCKTLMVSTIAKYLAIGIACLIGLGVVVCILYVLGWIWYYFCGGFLVLDDYGPLAGQTPFWDRVLYGLLSLLPLGFIIGFIAILGGWNPDN